jgi:methylated-DNA-protein-cysteine methyltransferase-like protein
MKAEQFYAVVRAVPRGRVVTYGQVAELAGLPRRHRAVARALRLLPPGTDVPWHRVVGKAGPTSARIAIRDEDSKNAQRTRLRDEGVRVSDADTISLVRHGWLPPD